MLASPSIPVRATTLTLVKDAPNLSAPVSVPVANTGALAEALAAAGRALLLAADALNALPHGSASQSLTAHTLPVTRPRSVMPAESLPVREAINEFLLAKARANRSERYLATIRGTLKSFAKGRTAVLMDEVTVQDVERWLFGQGWKAKTMRGNLGDVRTLFHFAVRRGYASSVQACSVELDAGPAGDAPGIHTAAVVASVLGAARRGNLDVMRHLAVRYFAGVRSAEAHRLTEDDIKLEAGFIQVPAVKSKTRRRRLVTIQPALAAWLALGGDVAGVSMYAVHQLVKAVGCDWPANVTRHSFCSYHLAMFENAGKTALEAGHSEAMLFAHYRAVVTKAEAEAFWQLRPS